MRRKPIYLPAIENLILHSEYNTVSFSPINILFNVLDKELI